MLTLAGCKTRRQTFLDEFQQGVPAGRDKSIVLTNPLHLRYFANFGVDPVSLNADFGGVLILANDGRTQLHTDNRLKSYATAAFVDEVILHPWYDGQSAGTMPRGAVPVEVIRAAGGIIHDSPAFESADTVYAIIHKMRRQKQADEIALLKECMRVGNAGHAWAMTQRNNGSLGTEIDWYAGVAKACYQAAKRPVIVYGDFAVSDGPGRKGGPPTAQTVKPGDMLILDFSVILDGYRSDFTNTLRIGGGTPQQRDLVLRAAEAVQAGEAKLKAGVACQDVYDAVRGSFAKHNLADFFPHHAGHGLGLTHPEAPFFVKQSSEFLLEGDVVTLEPGLYREGIGGVRLEHNYLITSAGFERLSGHEFDLGE